MLSSCVHSCLISHSNCGFLPGVAGADIISTNLASREGALAEVFNPTVPGKSVYALFAFAAINGFDHALKCLGGDVMILINDVARVLHDEVYRWGFGDSGQCNKNLGAAFLMVFRIGLVKEVVEKLEEATKVVFSTSDSKKWLKKKNRATPGNVRLPSDANKTTSSGRLGASRTAAPSARSKSSKVQEDDAMADAMQLSLQSLPGISTFTDRAVLGMLKSFAGIHRDNKLMGWGRDFRLSAGVGAFEVNMIFGMDAGWAVEGAVGSEYKIDATYLSPHVNMASRMMSACKHYGVTILLSEAVQELMSDTAKSKLRNVDRVTVKGSVRIQKIFTYDARHKGADFFLFSRSDDLADSDAEQYVSSIWTTDQDLQAMRHHITEDFESEFNAGLKAYYAGDWTTAIRKLESANEIMVEAAMEEGYLHDEMDNTPYRKELYRKETADGPCSYLVNFMKSKGGVAPEDWDGWHPLLSK
jgi:Adenylate and Guanylate cyclase catalytic domain